MSIEIEIDNTLLKKLSSIAAKKRISKKEYILRMLKTSIQLEDMKKIRKSLAGVARKNGFKSEQDIFDKIS